jgi:hypothetical protein
MVFGTHFIKRSPNADELFKDVPNDRRCFNFIPNGCLQALDKLGREKPQEFSIHEPNLIGWDFPFSSPDRKRQAHGTQTHDG